jgi:hypothetical protein
MSGKVFGRLFPALLRLSTRDSPLALTDVQLSELAVLNSMLGNVASRADLEPRDLKRLALCSEGAAIDGDWRNQVGRIALWATVEAMLSCLGDDVQIATATRRGDAPLRIDGLSVAERQALVDERWKPDTVEVAGYRIRMGAQAVAGETIDADITIARLDDDGAPQVIEATGEVKGSTDPANAKERWRLASGNIDAMSRIRSGRAARRPVTFYVGLVVTDGVVNGDSQITGMKTLLENRVLDAAFSLVKFSSPPERSRFCDFIRAQVGL